MHNCGFTPVAPSGNDMQRGDGMGLLQRFENRLEGVVTGAFARAFRSAVQPVEIAAALQREVDNSAHILSRDRRLVPNEFTVELSQSDYDRLIPFGGTLAKELAMMVDEHVKEQRYTPAGPLKINFKQAGELTTGRFRAVSYTHLRAHETVLDLVCRLLLEKKK